MRSDHLSKHIKRCQNRESAAARASTTLTKVDETLSASPEANVGQCTALDCAGYSANCPQCQNDQKLVQEDTFDNFALPAAPPIVRNAPSPTSFSCPASMFYNHFDAAASAQLAQQAVARASQAAANNLPISVACTNSLISFANGPFSVFNSAKPNADHSIDSIMFSKPSFKSAFEPSFILNEDSSSCSSLPPQMYLHS